MKKALCFLCLIMIGCGRASDFSLLSFIQEEKNGVCLNEALVFKFNKEVDRSSINPDTVSILNADGEAARGRWIVNGSEARFFPALPQAQDCSDSGLLPGCEYKVCFNGFPSYIAVLSTGGFHLDRCYSSSFSTVSGEPVGLSHFVDCDPGSAPVLVAVNSKPVQEINIRGLDVTPGSLLRLKFSEPLFPGSVLGQRAGMRVSNEVVKIGEEPKGGSGEVDNDFGGLDLVCSISTAGTGSSFVDVKPSGGFLKGRRYELWRDLLGFTDFGGNRIENTFSHIWINCDCQ